MDRPRLCARPACGNPATATLSYDYATSTVWLRELDSDPDAPGNDLCLPHADRLRVPRGWALDDRRTPIVALRPPLAV
ncbi:MAG TPA: DUF3499 family protein [Acidimicrobiales bacterium]|jgi:hypothetical protein|nr:DUF3499 family protein [Acidimicrobiales bacterium]